MNSLEKFSDIDIDSAKSETKTFAVISLFFLLLFILLDDFVFKTLSMFCLAYSGFVFSLHGLTVVVSKLSSRANKYFQIAISIFIPLVLSCQFIKDATNPSIEILLGNITPVWRQLNVDQLS